MSEAPVAPLLGEEENLSAEDYMDATEGEE